MDNFDFSYLLIKFKVCFLCVKIEFWYIGDLMYL